MTDTFGLRFAPCAARHNVLAVRLLGLVVVVVAIIDSLILLEGIGG